MFLRNKFDLEVNKANKKCPNINWAAKFCNHTLKARFTIVVPQCSIKPLYKGETCIKTYV